MDSRLACFVRRTQRRRILFPTNLGKKSSMRLMRTVSHTPMLSYCVGTSGQMIILSDHVLQQFDSSRQRKPGLAEAGGQLFASLADGHIRIEKATGPRKSDKRGRTHFL